MMNCGAVIFDMDGVIGTASLITSGPSMKCCAGWAIGWATA